MKYQEVKKDVEKRVNAFPIKYAFNDTQLEEGLKALGITKNEAVSIDYGGFIRKSDVDDYKKMWAEIKERHSKLIREDDEYVRTMFAYELANHEYCITYDLDDTLDACGISYSEIENDMRLNKLLTDARKKYLASVDW